MVGDIRIMKLLCWLSLFVSFLGTAACGGSTTSTADANAGNDISDEGADIGIVVCAPGDSCDDNDPCTQGDQCNLSGVCEGESYQCQSSNNCHEPVCDGAGGCSEELKPGKCFIDGECFDSGQTSGPGDFCFVCSASKDSTAFTISVGNVCNDGQVCTENDTCQEDGSCIGSLMGCDDVNGCTYDECAEASGGCTHVPVSIACDDDDACTSIDFCVDSQCVGQEAVVCADDGDPCTTESCDQDTGCDSSATPCEDGNDCTADNCVEGVGCDYPLSEDGDECDDGDACTDKEYCEAGTCTSDHFLNCDDDNPCTNDSCDESLGCVHIFNTLGCDDGYSCTIDDVCAAGICAGFKWGCDNCQPEISPHVNKVTSFFIPGDGNAGSGLDLDANPETCSPPGDCSDGIDNALGLLGSTVNAAFQDALVEGSLIYTIEFDGLNFTGDPFTMRIYMAHLDNESALCTCEDENGEDIENCTPWQTESCEYEIFQSNFDPDCAVRVEFTNASITGNVLTAGGPGNLFIVNGYLTGGEAINFVIFNATIEATITTGIGSFGAETITSMTGIVGGGVPKQLIKDALNGTDAIPQSVKILVTNYIDNQILDDLDIDGNGVPDAASIGIRFTTIPGVISSVQ